MYIYIYKPGATRNFNPWLFRHHNKNNRATACTVASTSTTIVLKSQPNHVMVW